MEDSSFLQTAKESGKNTYMSASEDESIVKINVESLCKLYYGPNGSLGPMGLFTRCIDETRVLPMATWGSCRVVETEKDYVKCNFGFLRI